MFTHNRNGIKAAANKVISLPGNVITLKCDPGKRLDERPEIYYKTLKFPVVAYATLIFFMIIVSLLAQMYESITIFNLI